MDKIEIGIKNIVILASSFNPSIFSHHWLIENEIINKDNSSKDNIFTSEIVQVVEDDMNMLILPDQLQLRMTKTETENATLNKLIKIVTMLPHIPYRQMGVNFIYFSEAYDSGRVELTKKLFLNPNNTLQTLFNTEDSRLGVYMSKNVDYGARLKLDIKPIESRSLKNPEAGAVPKIQYSFNYHVELNKDDSVENIKTILENWEYFNGETNKIMEIVKKL